MSNYNAALVIVSDTCYADSSQDQTGPAVTEFLNSSDGYSVTKKTIVPDEINEIRSEVLKLVAESKYELIVTSGGTGFSPRDVTPEAIIPLLEKRATGLEQTMTRKCQEITEMAALSRPVVGILGKCVLVSVPGSKKGAIENLDAVLNLLKHVIDLQFSESRQLHEKMKSDPHHHQHSHSSNLHEHSHTHSHVNDHNHSHSHGHSHTHSAPIAHTTVSQRPRNSPYPMIPLSESFKILEQYAPPLQYSSEPITSPNLLNATISESIYAPFSIPAWRTSIVDGYAIPSKQPGIYSVIGAAHARGYDKELKSLENGFAMRVTTGAPIPEGTECVVMVEDTKLTQEKDGEEIEIEVLGGSRELGENIREVGSDMKKGEVVVQKGTVIDPGVIGVLASVGIRQIPIAKKLVVGVMSTGDELVDLSSADVQSLKYGQIYDSNRPMLLNLLKDQGITPIDLGIAPDTRSELKSKLLESFSKVDIIITSGGVSMGELDLLKPVILHDLSATLHFGRVAMKPGKPTTFATLFEGTKVIFGLPGNPVSAFVTLHLFALPLITRKERRFVDVKLEHDFKLDPRPEFHRVKLVQRSDGVLGAWSVGMQRSSRVVSVADVDGAVWLPSSNVAGKSVAQKSSMLKCLLFK